MLRSELWRLINYKTPIKFYINQYIKEYDLSKANINALLYNNKISQDRYDTLYNLPKEKREVSIGLMIQKDRSIYNAIQSGIIEAKRRLFYSNDLDDINIVGIKNDAVFVIHKDLPYTEFPPFKFNIKNTYTTYLQLLDLEIFYYDEYTSDGKVNTNIDIKGINDENIPLHQNGILDVVCDVCFMLQRDNADQAARYLMDIYDKYVRKSLPVNYYRSFDSFSSFTLHSYTQTMKLKYMPNDISLISGIDIERNLLVLRDLLYIVMYIYNSKNRFG